jgi:hypothetical protein
MEMCVMLSNISAHAEVAAIVSLGQPGQHSIYDDGSYRTIKHKQ